MRPTVRFSHGITLSEHAGRADLQFVDLRTIVCPCSEDQVTELSIPDIVFSPQ